MLVTACGMREVAVAIGRRDRPCAGGGSATVASATAVAARIEVVCTGHGRWRGGKVGSRGESVVVCVEWMIRLFVRRVLMVVTAVVMLNRPRGQESLGVRCCHSRDYSRHPRAATSASTLIQQDARQESSVGEFARKQQR